MTKWFLRAAIFFFLLSTSVGVLLRWSFLETIPGLNFTYALHAHSHTLYFGWAALSIFALAFERIGADDAKVRWALGSIVGIAIATFLAFITGGYSRPAIIVSSVSLFVWAANILLFLSRARHKPGVEISFLRVAVVYVGIAGCSALGRVGILVAKVSDPLYGQLAVFGFLHAFASFFVFGLFGLLIGKLRDAGAMLEEQKLRGALVMMAALSFFTFPLGVHGGSKTLLGEVARIVAVLLVIPAWRLVSSLWKSVRPLSPSLRTPVRFLLGVWLAKASMELTGAFGFSEIATSLRHPAILYLHVLLLGFVSGAIILLIRVRAGRVAGAGFWAHQAGMGLMTLGLGLTSLPLLIPSVNIGLMHVGLVLATIAGAVIVLAAALWTRKPSPKVQLTEPEARLFTAAA